jgi:hypothetical protein
MFARGDNLNFVVRVSVFVAICLWSKGRHQYVTASLASGYCTSLVPSANFTSRQNFTPAFISKVQSGQPHSTRSELLSFCDAAPGMCLILVSCHCGLGSDSRHVNMLKQSWDICVFLPIDHKKSIKQGI